MLSKGKVVGYLKAGGNLVSSCGAQALACGIVRAVLPPGVNVIVQGGVLLGGLLLGGFVGEKLSDYTEKEIDSTVEYINETVDRVKRDLDTLKDKDDEKEKPEEKTEE